MTKKVSTPQNLPQTQSSWLVCHLIWHFAPLGHPVYLIYTVQCNVFNTASNHAIDRVLFELNVCGVFFLLRSVSWSSSLFPIVVILYDMKYGLRSITRRLFYDIFVPFLFPFKNGLLEFVFFQTWTFQKLLHSAVDWHLHPTFLGHMIFSVEWTLFSLDFYFIYSLSLTPMALPFSAVNYIMLCKMKTSTG